MEEVLNPHVLFVFLGLPVTKTVVSTWVVMGFLVLFSLLLTRRMHLVPTRFQNVLELFVEAILNLVEDMSPGNGRKFLPLVGTLALFIGTSDVTGLVPGLKSPTSDFNTTLALALVVFFAVPFYGIKTKGLKNYLKSYLSPSPILAPFHIVSEITRTVSLALRLFGNIVGEEIIIAILFLLSPLFLPLPMMLFSIFTGIIQAYIFTVLTVVYLSAAVESSGH
ncbi:MAG: F0F1 ATP synthase subunit A [Candidatus Caldatribacterium sp.]|uniref:F0F1 ATP synthase subunit A n=1 Tax=Candidatus Caldatribacterium sp. TaxID=2282143 RepID=UPI00299966B2|nr:F0F1 ATP synthase subunit A [Candidatus Caldatribacterium sp.]MCX7731263.1 F0F1 ATP synthase subunit A [Candidatus Caldatribacterium sp.]MDW8081463.1 F0F1 ATP synthase subunit A [Candidatus Calescibacterium sp.]